MVLLHLFPYEGAHISVKNAFNSLGKSKIFVIRRMLAGWRFLLDLGLFVWCVSTIFPVISRLTATRAVSGIKTSLLLATFVVVSIRPPSVLLKESAVVAMSRGILLGIAPIRLGFSLALTSLILPWLIPTRTLPPLRLLRGGSFGWGSFNCFS